MDCWQGLRPEKVPMILRMKLVLLSNLLWIIFLSGWCVLYFIQAKADVRSGGRYPDYKKPD